jgi:hypothetical protein
MNNNLSAFKDNIIHFLEKRNVKKSPHRRGSTPKKHNRKNKGNSDNSSDNESSSEDDNDKKKGLDGNYWKKMAHRVYGYPVVYDSTIYYSIFIFIFIILLLIYCK